MKSTRSYLFLVFTSVMAVNSCKKDNPPVVYASLPANASGEFTSVLNVSPYSMIDTIYEATAWFDSDSFSQEVSSVSCNGRPLGYTQSATGVLQIYFGQLFITNGNSVNWSIIGNSAQDIPSFSYNDQAPFPSAITFTHSNPVPLSDTFVINFSFINSGKETVYFSLTNTEYDNDTSFELAPGVTSVAFAPAQMATLGLTSTWPVVIEITVCGGYTGVAVQGKNYYFRKLTNYSIKLGVE